MSTDKKLFEEFSPISKKEWEQKIKEDLNGADYSEKLRWDTGEGIQILPFYRREDIEKSPHKAPLPKSKKREPSNRWNIRQTIYESNPENANQVGLEALDRGADALQFRFEIRRTEGMLGGDLKGILLQSQNDMSTLLQDIPIPDTPLHFDAGMGSPAVMAMLWNHLQNTKIDGQDLQGTLGYDPFIFLLSKGHYPKAESQLKQEISDLVRFTNSELPNVRPLAIDARFYHNGGATLVQELGYALAATSEYLAILTNAGISLDVAQKALHLNFSIGSSYFLEIGKIRASRLLWKNLLQAFGESSAPAPYIHGETSRWNKAFYDPYTNMLRTSTEGMSAAISGCDAITVLPFDDHFRQPDKFSQRIARNQQIILAEEAYMDHVADPSAGSYYIEKITDKIARKAWKVFQEVEAEGGLFKAIENGTVQSAINESQQQRDRTIARRGRIFVGTNQYCNPDEQLAETKPLPDTVQALKESEFSYDPDEDQSLTQNLGDALRDGAKLGDLVPHLFEYKKQLFRTISTYRGLEAFEKLRQATDQHHKKPLVLNLPLGHKKWRKARSSFSSNFFGCAGYQIEDPIGFSGVDEAIEAVKKQQPDIAVICSSDKEYKQLVPKIAEAVAKLDNLPILVLAGYPEEDIQEYEEAGVDEFIHSKCNVLETLQRFQQKLKISDN